MTGFWGPEARGEVVEDCWGSKGLEVSVVADCWVAAGIVMTEEAWVGDFRPAAIRGASATAAKASSITATAASTQNAKTTILSRRGAEMLLEDSEGMKSPKSNL